MYIAAVRPARALIVGGRDVVRVGLERVVQADPAIHLVGSVASGRRGIQLFSSLAPDVVLLDQVLPDTGVGEFCMRVSRLGGKVLVLTSEVASSTIAVLLRAGASGIVHLAIGTDELREAVCAVARGDAVIDPMIATHVLELIRERPIGRGRRLSRREAEVVRLVAGGQPDRVIASTLGVSLNTVKTYVRRALEKLHCATRSEAAAVVGRYGLLDTGAGHVLGVPA